MRSRRRAAAGPQRELPAEAERRGVRPPGWPTTQPRSRSSREVALLQVLKPEISLRADEMPKGRLST